MSLKKTHRIIFICLPLFIASCKPANNMDTSKKNLASSKEASNSVSDQPNPIKIFSVGSESSKDNITNNNPSPVINQIETAAKQQGLAISVEKVKSVDAVPARLVAGEKAIIVQPQVNKPAGVTIHVATASDVGTGVVTSLETESASSTTLSNSPEPDKKNDVTGEAVGGAIGGVSGTIIVAMLIRHFSMVKTTTAPNNLKVNSHPSPSATDRRSISHTFDELGKKIEEHSSGGALGSHIRETRPSSFLDQSEHRTSFMSKPEDSGIGVSPDKLPKTPGLEVVEKQVIGAELVQMVKRDQEAPLTPVLETPESQHAATNALLAKILKEPFPEGTRTTTGYLQPTPYLWDGKVWAILDKDKKHVNFANGSKGIIDEKSRAVLKLVKIDEESGVLLSYGYTKEYMARPVLFMDATSIEEVLTKHRENYSNVLVHSKDRLSNTDEYIAVEILKDSYVIRRAPRPRKSLLPEVTSLKLRNEKMGEGGATIISFSNPKRQEELLLEDFFRDLQNLKFESNPSNMNENLIPKEMDGWVIKWGEKKKSSGDVKSYAQSLTISRKAQPNEEFTFWVKASGHPKRAQMEAEIGIDAASDHTARTYGFCRDLIFMDQLQGKDLMITRGYIPKGGSPEPQQRLQTAREYIATMQFLHQNGIAHNDLARGNNAMLLDNGHIKLFDFGLSKKVAPDADFVENGTEWALAKILGIKDDLYPDWLSPQQKNVLIRLADDQPDDTPSLEELARAFGQ